MKVDLDKMAKILTDDLFEKDRNPRGGPPRLLGGDMCDPNYEGIKKTIAARLKREFKGVL